MSIVYKDTISTKLKVCVNEYVRQELTTIRLELDRLIQKDSLDSYEVDDLRDIQCLVNEAQKIEEGDLDISKKIDHVSEKINTAISKIEIFLNTYQYKEETASTLGKLISDAKNVLSSYREKLNSFGKKLDFIKLSLIPVTQIKQSIDEKSSKKIYEEWAKAFEQLAEGLEEYLHINQDIPLEIIEKFAKDVFSVATSKKTYNNFRKDEYKRRLKFSSSYIMRMITEKVSNIDSQLENKDYTIVTDLRSLVHAQYNIAQKQLLEQIDIKNIDELETEEDILEAAINLTS
ncbi:MAG: hypothetical protein NWQ28_07055 [Nodularia sp. (in: cyanobacteria)]|nr:hypothetical protein [Nodularia sp. (in: cyanobacteria)]